MNINNLRYKLPVITLIILMMFVLAMTDCSPQKAEAQAAGTNTQTAAMDAGIAELNTQLTTDSEDIHNQPANAEPQPVDYFTYLDFERKTYSDIRIWGWSPDGKVAYSDFLRHEGERFSVFIFDTVNDKIVWYKSLDLLAYYLSVDYDEDFNVFNSNFYLDCIDDFINKCMQNGIEFIHTEFMNIPIRHNSEIVNIILEKNETTLNNNELEDLGQYGGRIESYKVIAENRGRRKTIDEKAFQIYANDVFVCGYFVSPFEDRALIVIGEFAHGWEESVVTYSLVGCHLSIGFR